MTSVILATMYFLILALLTSIPHTSGKLHEKESSSSFANAHAHTVVELPISVNVVSNIGKPGVLIYNLDSESVIKVNFSVNCSTDRDVYYIVATTSAKQVAELQNSAVFNISCEKLKNENQTDIDSIETNQFSKTQNETASPNSPYIGVVEGDVNITIEAKKIGRSFLIFMASKKSTHGQHDVQTYKHYRQNEVNSLFKNQSLTGNTNYFNSKRTEFQNGSTSPMLPLVVGKAMIIVVKLPRLIDHIFRIILYVVIILATMGMGVKVDFAVIKKVLRRPTGPIIGICCQYICMPLIAYTVAKVVPQDSPAVSLGIFACGIAPGGGPSNMFTYLLGGDLSLSVTMTTLSSIAALGLLPLWLFTLGDNFKDETVTMKVPYEKILEALAIAILPLFVGMIIKYKSARISEIISKVLKPVLIVIVSISMGFGIYTNFYIFKMISIQTIIAGCTLPYVGYLVGGFLAFLCCRSWSHIKTIAIETGIQNTAIAFIILFLSLPPPDNQLAAVAPASSAIMTPLPLFVAVFFYTIYNRCTRRRKLSKSKLHDTNLENGTVPSEKSQIGVEENQREEIGLIILLWHTCKGTRPKRNQQVETISGKELVTMLPKNEKPLIN